MADNMLHRKLKIERYRTHEKKGG